jgi:hypothetical protein
VSQLKAQLHNGSNEAGDEHWLIVHTVSVFCKTLGAAAVLAAPTLCELLTIDGFVCQLTLNAYWQCGEPLGSSNDHVVSAL